MRIASITAGAAGMYCGSCLHDNTLVAALGRIGYDAILIPTYTPIRTDEPDMSSPRVFLGGINVYLDQSSRLFRKAPRFLRWLLDRPALINLMTRLSPLPDYAQLGELTISVLAGRDGRQTFEFQQLADWLAGEIRPDIVTLTNVLLSGIAPAAKPRLAVPILAYLQGDDVFLDALSEEHRRRCIEAIHENDRYIDGYIATCRDYADYMAGYLGIRREKIQVIIPGIDLKGYAEPPPIRTEPPYTIGYFARIAPEKGLHVLAEAYIHLRRQPGCPPCRLKASGWLGPHQRNYLAEVQQKLDEAGLAEEFTYVDSPDHASKIGFFQSLDVFSVPATFREPKGLYLLEALASGVPCVQPASGSFPELLTATAGGRLVPPDQPVQLGQAIRQLLDAPAERTALSRKGREAVCAHFSAEVMARTTAEVYARYLTATT